MKHENNILVATLLGGNERKIGEVGNIVYIVTSKYLSALLVIRDKYSTSIFY